jgi:2'-phosphotransferase
MNEDPDVQLSKSLSWILRHGAKGEGLSMRSDGYVKLDDLVC